MCIAIVKPRYCTVPVRHLLSSFQANPDGAGFAVARDEDLIVRKGFFSFEEFLDAYREEVGSKDPALIHFRIATSGRVDARNTHPWSLSGRICVIHNGVLPWSSTRATSDTGTFAREVLKPNRHQIFDEYFRKSVENLIGPRNKMAFLDIRGRIEIYNENSGHWHDGVWYSNNSYSRLGVHQGDDWYGQDEDERGVEVFSRRWAGPS